MHMTMKLLRDCDVPSATDAWPCYRETAWGYLAFAGLSTILALAAVGMPLAGGSSIPTWLAVLCGFMALLFAFLARFGFRGYRNSRAPESWLMRWSDEGLYLRFRSFHNRRFAADTPSVVYLDRREVAWLRRREARLDTPDTHGGWGSERKLRELEIGLARVDPAPLAEALAEEARRRDDRGVRTNHVPVFLDKTGSIRVEMRRPEAVLDKLSPAYNRGLAEDLPAKAFTDMTRDQQEDHLVELIQAGDKIAAVKAAREIYRCDLSEARRLVEEIATR
jgi:hypothetical protein